MFNKFTHIILQLASVTVAVASFAQTPQNKPSNQSQVSPANTVEAPPIAYPDGTKVNYVRTREALEPIIDEAAFNSRPYTSVKELTEYLDGLGRPLQTVARQAGAGSTPKDIVSPVKYDAFGREVFKYLPYAQTTSTNTSDGSFKTDPFNNQSSFYSNSVLNPSIQGEQVYYSKTEFEASPLNRITKTQAPGNSWAGSGKGVSLEYLVNDANDAVRIWNIRNSALTYDATKNIPFNLNVPLTIGTYGAGQLYKTVTVDEHLKKVIEYKDKEGKVILKKVQIAGVPTEAHDGWLCTYYAYDDFGQLRFAIPPKAVKKLSTLSTPWDLSYNNGEIINELCFRYEYDAAQRMIAKKVPGAGWVYMVYDKRDRLTYTQDANMRTNNQWMATLYDALNRPRVTGIIIYTGNRDDLQLYTDNNFNPNSSGANDAIANIPYPAILHIDTRETGRSEYIASDYIFFNPGFESESGAYFVAEIKPGGTNENVVVQNNPLPPGHNFIALTITYYDDYNHTGKTYNKTDNGKLLDDVLGTPFIEGPLSTPSTLTKGMVTGSKVRVLEDPKNLATGEWLETVNYYDDKGRLIQVQSNNYKHGTDIVTNLYDFGGNVLTTYSVYNNPVANQTVRVKTNLLYDHAGRLLEVKKKINDDPASVRTITRNNYDEMGQLKDKLLGQKRVNGTLTSDALETLSYEYNIRGWLKGINRKYNVKDPTLQTDRWFGIDLSYDWGFEKNQLNSNIAGMQWRSRGDGEQRAYGFGYDAASRIEYGDFNQNFNIGWGKDGDNFRIDFSMYMGDLNSEGQVLNGYDENGNILKMKQWGLKLNASPVIDQMSYSYNEGNKLLKVEEDINIGTNDNKVGDFTDKNRGSDDYGYDMNGNLIVDKNKRINGTTGIDIPANAGAIQYNHLNLPYKITVRTEDGTADKGYIKYIYDAAGNKLEKWVHEYKVGSTPEKDVITDYIAGQVYEKIITPSGDGGMKLQFFSQEEGRVRLDFAATQATDKYKYDYFIKDHLGNVRMVLTDENQSNLYPALSYDGTTEQINTQNAYWENSSGRPIDVLNIRFKRSGTAEGDYQQLLRKSTGAIGATKLLKVMSGDRIHGKVDYYFSALNANNSTANGLNSMINSLLTTLQFSNGVSSAIKTQASTVTTQINADPNATSFFSPENPSSGINEPPKAYLHILLFNEQFKFDKENSYVEQVKYIPNQVGTIDKMFANSVEVKKNGYAYIYISNESDEMVYFDNLLLTHERGPLLEETHYYPFGLTMAGISSRAAGGIQNKYKYNDKEEQRQEFSDGSGLEWLDYGWRMYDPQIGRWHVQDQLASNYEWASPYAYVLNMPLRAIDPDGRYFFGLFGSTAEQRHSARKLAEMTGGEVENIGSKKNIHVNYQTAKSGGENNNVTVTPHNVYFSNEGVPIGKSARDFINTSEGKRAWNKLVGASWVNTSQWVRTNTLTGATHVIDGGDLGRPLLDPIDLAAGLTYGLIRAAGTATVESTGTQLARTLGAEGEEAVGIVGAKTRIPSLTGTATYRIPDRLTALTLEEVKNVQRLGLTNQIKDFNLFSQQTGRQFIIYTRSNTTYTAPMQNLINQGQVVLKNIPGL